MRWRTFVALLAAALASAHAQERGAATLEGRTVSRIVFEPPDQPLPREELDRLLPLQPGDSLRMSTVRDAIQRLYATGRYAEIEVDAGPEGAGVAVTFSTELNYFISRVSVAGENEPPNRNQLITASNLDLGAIYDPSALPQAIGGMEDRLRANGFYRPRIQQRVDLEPATEEASLYFDVNTGGRAHFGGAEFFGQFAQDPERLEHMTGWRRSLGPVPLWGWRELTENRLQSGIENLRREFQKNNRLQARVTLDELLYDPQHNRVTPRLSIESGPVIEVRTTGAKVGDNRLRELLPIYQERSVDRSLLLEGQRNLTEHFRSEGYFDAVVSFTQNQESQARSIIEYNIDRGMKHKLSSVTIAGNRYFDTLTLRERMYIQPATLLRYRNGRYSPRQLDQDIEAIRNLYRANGFREVNVVPTVEDNPGAGHTNLAVSIEIDEGRQWFVEALTIEGASEEDAEYLRGQLRSSEGQPYSESNVAADRDTILGYFFNAGYTDATFEWGQAAGANETLVKLQYRVTAGERQYVRGVLVRGLDTTDASLVASRISLRPGDPVSQSEIAASQQRLYDLGIFAKVQTALQNPEGAEERKHVLFYLDEASRYSLNFGVGAELARIGGGTTSFDSPAGAAGFAPRISVGISRINFLGIGHTVSLQTLTSTQQRRALLNYVAPQFQGNPDLSLTFSALFNDARDVRTFAARRWEGAVQLSQRLSRANTIQGRYSFRRVTLDPNSLKISPSLIPLLSQPVRVGQVALTYFQDRRDDPVNTKRGVYNTIDLGYAAGIFGSEAEFARLLLRNSTYHSLNRDIVLARSLQFGYIQRLGGLEEVPLAERFFAGGASTHRGFPDNQAGPRDLDTGFPLGGQALLFHSTELRFPLIGDNLGGVMFHDMGNVFADIRDIGVRFRQRDVQDFDYMVQAAGFGIRYRTPVGPLRVDLSYSPNAPRFFGFSGTRDELLAGGGTKVDQKISGFQFHFSLGQTF